MTQDAGGGIKAKVVEKLDGFFNLVTGLGTWRDKARAVGFQPTPKTDDVTLEYMYRSDDMVARVIELLPNEALREGFCIEIAEDEENEKVDAAGYAAPEIADEEPYDGDDIDDALDALKARERLSEAWKWARLFGGAAVYIGAADGKQALEPLDEDAVDSIEFLNVIDRRALLPMTYYSDPLAKNYGRIATYRVTAAGLTNLGALPLDLQPVNVEIHESRLIIFEAMDATPRMRAECLGWTPSVVERIKEPLSQFQQAWQAISNLMLDNSQGVFTIDGLRTMLVGSGRRDLQARMEVLDMSRSVARSLVVDKDEKFERVSTPMEGYAPILVQFAIRFAAAARVPVTVLFGQSPTGLNATGEEDTRHWYDTVRAEQNNYLRPKIERLARLVFKSKKGPTSGQLPDDWTIKFFPLYQPDGLEEEQRKKTIAERDAIYLTAQVLLPEEVAIHRFGSPDGFEREIMISQDERAALLEANMAGMVEEANTTPDDTPPTPAIDPLTQSPPPNQLPPPPPSPSPQATPGLDKKSA